MTILYLDSETFSPTPIKHGLHRYAEKVEVMLASYAFDDEPAECWDRTAGMCPARLWNAIKDPSVQVVIHNSQFDRTVMSKPPLSWIIDPARVFDTMACALSHSLPGSLDSLCEILGVPTELAKLKTGKQLINLFCKPNAKGERNTRETHPQKWLEFIDYAKGDIPSMREVYKRLPKWNYPTVDRGIFTLDQRINERGVAVDVELAEAAVRAVDLAQQGLGARARKLTNNAVQSARQRGAMLAHILEAYGITLPDMTASTLERRINDPDLPAELRELLAVRLQATTSSTAKYQTLLNGVSSDGRLRGTLQYCGAARTGRWSGRLFQPQNLPRPVLDNETIDTGIAALKADCADLVFENVMELTSSAIRGCIVAAPGKKLVVADLSNIEGRVLAWVAGEQWKLDAFAAFDGGEGHDLYKLAYARAFGIKPEDVDKSMRQIGKVMELALGYEGGVGAFLTFAAAYGLDLDELAARMEGTIPADVMAECNKFWAWAVINRATLGLEEHVFKACDALKRLWRRAHPKTGSLWRDLEETVRDAIASPGVTFAVARLKVRRDGAWLRIVLPSGRALCYPSPQLKSEECKTCKGTGKVCGNDDLTGPYELRCDDCGGTGKVGKPKVTYMGTNQYTRKWSRISTYGGKLVENVVQAIARDILADGMWNAEHAGYAVVLSVHDELLTEAPVDGNQTVDGLAECMTRAANGQTYSGLPLAAAGFEALRYKKD